jgi:hypothetical protein
MTESLKDLLKRLGQDSVINNPDIPNEQNEAVLASAEMSIINGLKKLVSQGKSDELARMAADPNGAEAQQLQSGFVQNLMDRLGIQQETAKNIATSLIPQVLGRFNLGTNGFDITGLQALLTKVGLDKDGDGDVDLGDFKKMIGL